MDDCYKESWINICVFYGFNVYTAIFTQAPMDYDSKAANNRTHSMLVGLVLFNNCHINN